MVDISFEEVVELFPFAARKADRCELRKGDGPDLKIPLKELLDAVASHRPLASVHEKPFDEPTIWGFYRLNVEGTPPIWAYTLTAYMTVEEARALRDAEMSLFEKARRRIAERFSRKAKAQTKAR